MPNESVEAKLEDLDLSQEKTVIVKGEPALDMTNVLIRKPEQAFRKLKTLAPTIKHSDIEVLGDGRVVIRNEELNELLSKKAREEPAANRDNFVCNMGCGNG